jgi:mannose-6-phosphate isomerase
MTGEVSERPWGHEELVFHGPYVMKRLVVREGQRLSLQFHVHKTETLFVFRGHPEVIVGEESRSLGPGDTLHIPAGTVHRIIASRDEVEVIEARTPELDDVVRIEDDYGRAGLSEAPIAAQ